MRIKKIEIIGFKSFCDRMVLQIEDPITGVVGPNGCGKSNIVDAIRWAMGEMSAKHLRGKSMDDVIFNGSESRGPAAYAEVTLTFAEVGLGAESRHSELDLLEGDELELGDDSPEAAGGSLAGEGAPDPAAPDAVLAADPAAAGAGAAARPVVAEAETTPIIDFSQYGEVAVTRRLYRDGTSEYELNKVPCRLKDITEFFLGTGVGTKAYSIIEQGRIGLIVSAKPEDRRAIIEEAAGITKFKAKKRAAERKIEGTRQNLLRVSDVVAEIEKRLGSLRRQAQKAERYRRYKAEIKDLELLLASQRFLALDAETRYAGGMLAQVAMARDAANAELASREDGLAQARLILVADEQKAGAFQERLYEVENKLSLIASSMEFSARESRDLDQRAEESRGELARLASDRAELAADLVRLAGEAAELDERVRVEQNELGDREAALAAVRGEYAAKQTALDAARQQISREQQKIARAEEAQRALERRRGEMDTRIERMIDEGRRTEARLGELGMEIGGLDGNLGSLRQLKLDLGLQKEELEARVNQLRQLISTGETEVEARRAELGRRKSRLDSLREIAGRYEGFQRGVRSIMLRKGKDGDAIGDGIRGLVADAISAPAELEVAVEAVLGDRIGHVLVNDHETGRLAVEHLKRRSEGRGSFIALNALRAGATAAAAAASPDHDEDGDEDGDEVAAFGDMVGGTEGQAQSEASRMAGVPAFDPMQDSSLLGDDDDEDGEAVGFADAGGDQPADAQPEALGGLAAGGPTVVTLEMGADGQVHESLQVAPALRPGLPDGVRGSLLSMVEVTSPELAAVAGSLLGDVYLVDSLARALELFAAGQSPGTLVTFDGEVLDGSGVLTGGSREVAGAGVLAQKREIRELEELCETLQTEFDEIFRAHVARKNEIVGLRKALDDMKSDAHAREMTLLAHEKDVSRAREEQRRLAARQHDLENEVGSLRDARAEAERESETLRIGIREAEDAAGRLEADQLALTEEILALRVGVDEAAARVTESKVTSAQTAAQRSSVRADEARQSAQARRSDEQRVRLEAGIDEASVRSEELRAKVASLAEEREQSAADKRVVDEELTVARAIQDKRAEEIARSEADLKGIRDTARALADETSHLELKVGQLDLKQKNLEEQILERYRLELRREAGEYHLRPLAADAEESRVRELRDLIDRLGEINLMAIEECAELETRYNFLTGQRKDLESALDLLEKAIARINKTSRKLFRRTFDAVNAQFQELFPRLFRGGRAHLALTQAEDILDAGVEIFAQPPGKKNGTVELLSGGEKALTAVAMIFAIFLVKPSPFCLLDEVNAPLDEANVSRYNELVRSMTDRSQFIVITHNKRTMQIADTLYGITMQEPGVSKLVSVNLKGLDKLTGAKAA